VRSVCRCPPRGAAPPTSGGAVVRVVTRAARPGSAALRPRHHGVPADRPSRHAGGPQAGTVGRRRGLSWSGEMASGEVWGLAPGIWDELAAGTPGSKAPVGVRAQPD
jgi:hypothetical protein